MDEKHVAPPRPDVVERLIPSYGPGVVDPNGPGPVRRVAPIRPLSSIAVAQPSADMEIADSDDEEIKMAAELSMKEAEERKRKYDEEEQERKKSTMLKKRPSALQPVSDWRKWQTKKPKGICQCPLRSRKRQLVPSLWALLFLRSCKVNGYLNRLWIYNVYTIYISEDVNPPTRDVELLHVYYCFFY